MAKSKAAREILRDFLLTGRLAPVAEPEVGSLRAVAREQGLAGVLHAALEAAGRPWPSSLHAALADERRSHLVRGVRQLELAGRVQSVLEGLGIGTLPLKGAALAEDLYEGEGDRPMADVDLLAPARWREALDLLELEGFGVLARGDHAWALGDPLTGFVVELHHSVTSCPGLFPVDGPTLLARSRSGSGQVRRLPSPEDLLVHLCLHAAFQHGLVLSLVQWLDFRRLLERRPPDPGRLAEAAEAARAGPAVAAALRTAELVVGAQPAPDLREWRERQLTRGLRKWLWARANTPFVFVHPHAAPLARLRLALVPGRRLSLVLKTLSPDVPGAPTNAVQRTLRALPRGLSLARRMALRTRWLGSGQLSETEPETPRGERVLVECLAAFPDVRFTVSGRCMEPALAEGERVVVEGAQRRRPRLGDVVLLRHPEGLRLHRLVYALGRSWRTKADHARGLDPALVPRDVLGTVVAVEGRPDASPRRPSLALLAIGQALLARLRPRA